MEDLEKNQQTKKIIAIGVDKMGYDKTSRIIQEVSRGSHSDFVGALEDRFNKES